MRNTFLVHIIPPVLAVMTAIMIAISLIVYKSEFMANIFFNTPLVVAFIYSIITPMNLQADLKERAFWKNILLAFGIYSLGMILRNYVFPFIGASDTLITITQILYVIAMFIMIFSISRLIKILGIKLDKKTNLRMILIGTITFLVLSAIIIPGILGTKIDPISLPIYIVLAVFCAVSVPLTITFYRETRTGALRVPFLFMSISISMLVIQTACIAIGYSIGNPSPTLHPSVIAPYILFLTFAMMSMGSRIEIAQTLKKELERI